MSRDMRKDVIVPRKTGRKEAGGAYRKHTVYLQFSFLENLMNEISWKTYGQMED
jgi:hypothetical protein